MSIENGRWAPGIGDPTIMGWVTVGFYFAATLLCFGAAIKTNIEQDNISPGQDKELKFFWFCLSIFLMFLGINKQLDLQSLLTQVGKDMAIAQGWYEKRRAIQFLFIILIGGAGVILLSLLARKFWKIISYINITLVGCIMLFMFIMIRAMSFHHVDILISTRLAGIKMNWLFEIGGLVVILLGILKYLRNIKNRKAL